MLIYIISTDKKDANLTICLSLFFSFFVVSIICSLIIAINTQYSGPNFSAQKRWYINFCLMNDLITGCWILSKQFTKKSYSWCQCFKMPSISLTCCLCLLIFTEQSPKFLVRLGQHLALVFCRSYNKIISCALFT